MYKKRLFAIALLALSSIAFGATLVPVQLLNPVGSTSGQAVLSNGPAAPPAWKTITLDGITGFTGIGFVYRNSANSYITVTPPIIQGVGGTGLSTVPNHALLVGGALNAMTALGTGAAGQVLVSSGAAADPAFSSTLGAMAFSGLITPASTIGIKGTVTNDSPAAGSIGENPNNATTAASLTTGTTANATSVPLSAGDWDLECVATFVPAATTTVAGLQVGVSTTSATFPTANTGATVLLQANFTAGQQQLISSPVWTAKLASAGTGFCVVNATFATSTMTVNGFIRARRPR